MTQYRANKMIADQKAEREKKLREVQIKIADCEQRLDLLTLYTETFLKLIGQRVKAVFGNIDIRLIETNIKAGSWNECCYVLDSNGVPYETTNTASKIKLGVNIIDILVDKLGMERPAIIIDNSEAITSNNRTFATASQIICLVASDEPINVQPKITNLFGEEVVAWAKTS